MSKFKIGDKVRTVDGPPWLDKYRGVRAVITNVGSSGDVHATLEGGPATVGMEHEFVRAESSDEVNPPHYSGDLVMRVIEERGLDFALGNAVKYLCRAGSKGDKMTDLKKAQWYLERAIAKEEATK